MSQSGVGLERATKAAGGRDFDLTLQEGHVRRSPREAEVGPTLEEAGLREGSASRRQIDDAADVQVLEEISVVSYANRSYKSDQRWRVYHDGTYSTLDLFAVMLCCDRRCGVNTTRKFINN